MKAQVADFAVLRASLRGDEITSSIFLNSLQQALN